MAKEIYLPLKYAIGYKEEGTAEILRELATEEVFDKANYDELLEYVNDDRFYTKDYTGKFQILNENIRRLAFSTSVTYQNETPAMAWGDIMSMYALVGKWSENKQVYQFDADFAEALSQTASLRIYPELLRRLPYNDMYFDISEVSMLRPYSGIFVGVRVMENDDVIIMGHKLAGDLYFTGTIKLNENRRQYEHGTAFYEFSKEEMVYPKDLVIADLGIRAKGVTSLDNRNFPELWMFLFQALTYLSSDQPDIAESKLSKRTYRPTAIIKNKFSEIRQWEVGLHYGAEYRKQKKEELLSAENIKRSNGHRSPRPHTRRAHWHHYWTGEGRTQPIVKWLKPVFVGARGETITTIHKAKGA